MTEYSEGELILPTLAFLDQAPAGLTTTQLIGLLTEAMRPDGRDAQILGGRRDTYFSQKVRNLVSHRSLAGRGLTVYDPARQLQVITPAGVAYLERERARLGGADRTTRRRAERSGTRFGDYRRANETPRGTRRRPFEVDPNEVDRTSAAHARIQNALAVWVTGRQLKPLSWAGGDRRVRFGLACRLDTGRRRGQEPDSRERNESAATWTGAGASLSSTFAGHRA